MEVKRITKEELKQKIDRKEDCIIIDVRNPTVYTQSPHKIKGAIRIEMDKLEAAAKDLPKDKDAVTYCT
ncbi:MAG: hypothetical protein HZC45_03125 [Deltaproteobacteria bacterium]|nr:hypothetical protein [Deltaproteobacteria bacterium]